MARYTLRLKMEPIAGSDVRDVAVELCAAADRIGVMCEAQFNDVSLVARPGCNPLRLCEAYQQEIQRPGNHFKIAQAI